MLLEDYDDYARRARLWTSIHAQIGRSEMPAANVDVPSEPPKERRPARRLAKDLPKDLVNKEPASEIHPPVIVLGNILSSTNSNVANAGNIIAAAGSSTGGKKPVRKAGPGAEAPKKPEGAKRKVKEAGGGVGKEVSERKRAMKRL